MPPEAPAAPAPPAAAPKLAPERSIGGSFFEKLSAPPAPHEIQPGAKAPEPAPSGPAADPVAPPITPEPAAAEVQDPAPAALEKPARLEVPAKGAEPASKGEPTPDEVDEYLKLSEEEQDAKLSKLSKSDAHKLARKAFNRAGKMLQDKATLEQKLKDMQDAGKEVDTLKAKIKNLEEAPETKANQERLAKLEADLTKAQEDFKGEKERVEKDKKYVEGLQFAHDVKKTPRWKEYVSAPSAELVEDIKLISASLGEDKAQQDEVFNSIIYALNQADESARWRALKAVGETLPAADQTMLANIFKGHQRIEKNKAFLQGQSDEARAALDEGRAKEETEKKATRTKEFQEGAKTARENFSKDLPWVSDDFDIAKYPEEFQKVIQDTRAFAKKIEAADLTPGQEAKVKQGYAYFQGAAILNRNYSKALETENTQLREELKAFQDKEAAAAAAEAEKEKNRGELTPSAAPKKAAVNTKPAAPVVPVGQVRSAGGSFASMVMKGS